MIRQSLAGYGWPNFDGLQNRNRCELYSACKTNSLQVEYSIIWRIEQSCRVKLVARVYLSSHHFYRLYPLLLKDNVVYPLRQ